METRRSSINTKRPEISVNICVASAAEKEYFAAVLNRSRALASYIDQWLRRCSLWTQSYFDNLYVMSCFYGTSNLCSMQVRLIAQRSSQHVVTTATASSFLAVVKSECCRRHDMSFHSLLNCFVFHSALVSSFQSLHFKVSSDIMKKRAIHTTLSPSPFFPPFWQTVDHWNLYP